MTDTEATAITLLNEALGRFRDDNIRGHDKIETAIKDLRNEVARRFDAGETRFHVLEATEAERDKVCAERALTCAAVAASAKVSITAEIVAAEMRAVAAAKTAAEKADKAAKAPGVYRQATQGLGKFLRILVVTMALIVGLILSVWALIDLIAGG